MILTASAIDRAAACPGSTALPQLPHVGADTAWGATVARFRDTSAKRGRAAALGEIDDPEDQARCAAIDMASQPAGVETEVAIAYHPADDRAVRLALDGPRAYPDLGEGWIYGTADAVGMLSATRLYLSDDKSGTLKVRAQHAGQLRFLALAFCRAIGIDEAEGAMLYLRHDGTWFADRFSFDAFDLEAIRFELLELQAAASEARRVVAAGGIPQLLPGPHCEHCGAAPKCPAQERQQEALVKVEGEDLTAYVAALDEAAAGALVEKAIVVAKLAEKVREAAKARVEQMGDLPLPSGRTLARVKHGVSVETEVAKGEIAALKAALRERGEIFADKVWQVRVTGARRAS